MIKIVFAELSASLINSKKQSHALIFAVHEDKTLSAFGKDIDKKTGGMLTRALLSKRFGAKKTQFLNLSAPYGLQDDALMMAGLGKGTDVAPETYDEVGGAMVAQLNAARMESATIIVEQPASKKIAAALAAGRMAMGATLRAWRFDKYRTTMPEEEKPTLTTLTIAVKDAKKAEAEFKRLRPLVEGVFLTRELVSEPPNVIYPESFVERVKKQLAPLGIKIDVLGEKEMTKLGMFSLLGVGQGSVRESKIMVMRWEGDAKSKEKPLAFIGKGVCFDSGGISIKPASGMEDMKWDMAGAGTVVGLMAALAGRKAKVNAIGAVGLVENMPDGNAQRPGDVVRSMSGQTIEVINTDAEGRLVLADVLHYINTKYKPRFMIDLATLTGAIIIALGSSRAGLFSNDDTLAERLHTAGKQMGEEVWRLPLGDIYDKQINSDIADMKNVGEGREAGSITAAQFLQRFVGTTPWVHLDIAGTAWSKRDSHTVPKGATAFGVRLLNHFVMENYEGK